MRTLSVSLLVQVFLFTVLALPCYGANRLALSESAYLSQHANNPIDWYPWGDAAFTRAREEDRLIFLSIGYASCHWCHVMEAESFSDIEVAQILNQSMVSIKVDREQQPDIDAYFTLAVEAVKGESGWPMTLVLLPDRSPVFAANYLGKDQLIMAVTRLTDLWQTQPEMLERTAAILSGEIKQRSKGSATGMTLSPKSWADLARKRLLQDIDPVHGGFGQGKKFPGELKLQFLLDQYKKSRDTNLRDTLIAQLDLQMGSGLVDIVYGGIFRYTTDRQLKRPHFEKMLYNQALTVSLYCDAAIWLEKPAFRRHAESIVRFTRHYLRLTDGTYASAIDADYEGVEGGYYLWPGDLLKELNGDLSRVPFGDHRFYLYGSPVVEDHTWRSTLKQYRSNSPNRIDNSVTSWNALWISALLSVGEIEEAQSLSDIIWDRFSIKNQLLRMGNQLGFLDDYSYLSRAFWQLYLKTESIKWKNRARVLANQILDDFYHDGHITYRSKHQFSEYETDVFQDSELPSSLAVTLNDFKNHQTELKFIEAYDNLKAGLSAAIGKRPEYYLALIQSLDDEQAASEQIIAKGHGMISLQATDRAGRWKLAVNLDEGWHINASEVFDQRLIPTRVLKAEEIQDVRYPQGNRISTDFSADPLNVYSDRVEIDIKSDKELDRLILQVRSQACSSKLCLLPEINWLIAPATLAN